MQRQRLDDRVALYRRQNSSKEGFEQIILLVR
jgi:hypothetical protein